MFVLTILPNFFLRNGFRFTLGALFLFLHTLQRKNIESKEKIIICKCVNIFYKIGYHMIGKLETGQQDFKVCLTLKINSYSFLRILYLNICNIID